MSNDEKTIADLEAKLEAQAAEIRALREQLNTEGSKFGVDAELMNEIESEGARLASVGAWKYDLATSEIFWTPEVFKIHGIPVGEVPSYDECISFYAEKDQTRLREAVKKLAENAEPYDMECEFIDAHGQHRFVRIIGRVHHSENGKPIALSGIIQDITGQHLMRRGMEAFFRLTPDLIGAVDFDSRPITLSPSWQTVLGWSKYEMIRMGIDCVVHSKDQATMRSMISRAISSGEIESFENRVVSKEGGEFWYSWRLFADSTTELVFIAARDVTKQKATEKALKDAKIQSEAANQAKSDFLAVMSHELRTPLNPILGFADLLLAEIKNPEHSEILEAISRAGQHLTMVIGDVLDFAKIESGRVDVSEESFDLHELLSRNLRLMEGQLKGKPVELLMNYEKARNMPDDCRFIGDPEKISRILFNLLGNAIKFTDKGSVTLDSSLTLTGDGRAVWHVDVRDTGIGIADDSHQAIFQPFSMGDASSTRRHGGTGLGLAICEKLVELMGGSINAKSRLGEGTCMTFILPLKVEEGAEPAIAEAEDVDPEVFLQGKRHVLFVEDNPTNIFYIRRLMETMGCEVTCAASGEEAVAEYTPGHFDLLLLDIHMPGLSGVEVLKKIREQESQYGHARVPILILTADVLPATRDQCMKYGADGFLTKPVRARELFHAVSLVMEGAS